MLLGATKETGTTHWQSLSKEQPTKRLLHPSGRLTFFMERSTTWQRWLLVVLMSTLAIAPGLGLCITITAVSTKPLRKVGWAFCPLREGLNELES